MRLQSGVFFNKSYLHSCFGKSLWNAQ